MIRNVIFDLDGTLFDSFPSIENTARLAVTRVLPELPPPDLSHLIGPPIARMFAQLWPDLPPEKMAALLSEFRQIYDSTGCLDALPYPGVVSLLERWHREGVSLFVLTNKPIQPTCTILQHHGLVPFFTEICSPDAPSFPFASKPEGACKLAAYYGLLSHETVLVGDGQDDFESAHCCGFRFIHASYGYGRLHDAQHENFTRLQSFPNLEQILRLLSSNNFPQ